MLSSIQILVKWAIAMLKKANKNDRATDNPKGSIQHNEADKNQPTIYENFKDRRSYGLVYQHSKVHSSNVIVRTT